MLFETVHGYDLRPTNDRLIKNEIVVRVVTCPDTCQAGGDENLSFLVISHHYRFRDT